MSTMELLLLVVATFCPDICGRERVIPSSWIPKGVEESIKATNVDPKNKKQGRGDGVRLVGGDTHQNNTKTREINKRNVNGIYKSGVWSDCRKLGGIPSKYGTIHPSVWRRTTMMHHEGKKGNQNLYNEFAEINSMQLNFKGWSQSFKQWIEELQINSTLREECLSR